MEGEIVKFLLLGILLPAVVLGLAQAAGQWARGHALRSPAEGRPDGERGAWEAALVGGLAYAWGHSRIQGWPAYPPFLALDVLVWVVGGSGVLAAVACARRGRPFFAYAWVAPVALLAPIFASSWQSDHLGFFVFLLGAVLLVGWALLDCLAERAPGAALPLALVLAATALSGVLVIEHNAKLAQMAGVLAAIAGTAMVMALAWPGYSIAGAIPPIFSVGAMSLLINARFYSTANAPLPAHLLAWLAPLGLWVAELPVLRRRPPWLRAAVGLGVVVVLLGVAVGWTLAAQPPASEFEDF